jgi:hypothetical protein
MFRLKKRFFPLLASSWLTLGTCLSASEPGWLVYELKFKPDAIENLNFQFYTGAYVVSPITGGPSSLILTSEDNGRVYTLATNAARIFTVASPASRKTVLSAVALNGSAQASYMATGEVNKTVSLPGPKGIRSFRVAANLRGMLMANDDDSEARTISPDGTLGMVGSAQIEGIIREDLTYNASQHATQSDAVLYLAGLLERYGYTDEMAPTVPVTIEGGTPLEGTDASLFPDGSAAEATSKR